MDKCHCGNVALISRDGLGEVCIDHAALDAKKTAHHRPLNVIYKNTDYFLWKYGR